MAAAALARRWTGRLHSWIGAVAAIFIIVVALSGAALAFVDELFEWEFGAMLDAPGPAARPADVDRLIAGATAANPGFTTVGVLMPRSRLDVGAAMVFGLPTGASDPAHDTTMLAVDPATGAFQGAFNLHDAFGHQLIEFHHALLAGKAGVLFVSVLGVLLAAFALSGLWLWWPRGGGAAAKAARLPRRGRPLAFLFRLHSFAGVWAALLIVVFAFTGVGMTKPGWLGLPSDLDPSPEFEARDCGAAVTPGQAAAAALRAHPGAALATLYLPRAPGAAYGLGLKRPGDVDVVGGGLLVFASSRCPGLVETHRAGTAHGLQRALLAVHGGRALGPLGPPLVFAGGLAAALLAGSGLYVWAARTFGRPRRAAARGLAAMPQPAE